MPYRNSLEQFNKENGYNLDVKRQVNFVSGVVQTYKDPEKIDNTIKENLLKHYLAEAKRYEIHRQRMIIRSKAKPNNKKLSDTVKTMASAPGFLRGYIRVMEMVAEHDSKAKGVQHNYKYDHLPLFGINSTEYTNLVKEQLSAYSYKEGRRYQLLEVNDVKFPELLDEAQSFANVANEGKDWREADEADKEKIYKTYITKEIMKERLASKNFLWKWIFRGETRSMQSYIASAEKSLRSVNFDEDAAHEAEAFAAKSYAMADPEQKDKITSILNQRTANMDTELEKARENRKPLKAQYKVDRDEKKEQEKTKAAIEEKNQIAASKAHFETDAVKAEVERVNSNEDLTRRLFEIRFRPPFNKAEFDKIRAVAKTIDKNVLKEAEATHAQKYVYSENLKKLSTVKAYFESLEGKSEEEIKLAQDKLTVQFLKLENLVKGEANKGEDEYKPLTGEDIKKAEQTLLSEELALDVNPNNKVEIKKPIEADKKIDPVTKKIGD